MRVLVMTLGVLVLVALSANDVRLCHGKRAMCPILVLRHHQYPVCPDTMSRCPNRPPFRFRELAKENVE